MTSRGIKSGLYKIIGGGLCVLALTLLGNSFTNRDLDLKRNPAPYIVLLGGAGLALYGAKKYSE